MNGYLLYSRDEETCLVLKMVNDDELLYVLRKLERSREKWLKSFAQKLMEDFFAKSSEVEPNPPVTIVTSD